MNVNPPPLLRIPESLRKDPAVFAYEEQKNTIIFQLYNRSGGNTDLVEEGGQLQTASGSRVSRNAAKINALELKEFEVITTTADLTTNLNQIIICKNTVSINITLNDQAVEGDEVHIKRRDAIIEVIGSIDGLTNKTINVLNYSMHLVFDGTDWSEI